MTLIIVVDAVEFDIYTVALREQIFDLRDAHVHALCLRAVAFLRRNGDFCDVFAVIMVVCKPLKSILLSFSLSMPNVEVAFTTVKPFAAAISSLEISVPSSAFAF